MKTTLLILKLFLITILSRKSTCLMFGGRISASISWRELWQRMTIPDNKFQYKSSCPWDYIKDMNTGKRAVQLLQIKEKWCPTCCIDLIRSNATHVVPNYKGQCQSIEACGVIVGYTCVYAVSNLVSIHTNKRNEGVGPLVNRGSLERQTTPQPLIENISVPTSSITLDLKTNTKAQITDTAGENENNNGHFEEKTDYFPTVVQQHGVPPFFGTGNAQFRYPPFLQNNNAQFRPTFLNGMGMQMRQQQIMPMFANSQRHLVIEGKETPLELTEQVDRNSNIEFLDIEDTEDQQPTESGVTESTVQDPH